MSEPSVLDRTHTIILRHFVETGQAPHYTAIAKELGVGIEEGRKALHDLMNAGVPGWLYPRTDIIVSMAPFNSLQNQFRLTIDGQQKWFGQ
jgi:hypothetical protein